VLVECLGDELDPSEYVIQVSQWETFAFRDGKDDEDDRQGYCFHAPSPSLAPEDDDVRDEEAGDRSDQVGMRPSRELSPRRSTLELPQESPLHYEDPHMSTDDLWDTDNVAHNVTREGLFMGGGKVVTEGCPGEIPASDTGTPRERPGHFHRRTIDASTLMTYNLDIETETIKERLHGYVRP
jgi:hypothetical protein